MSDMAKIKDYRNFAKKRLPRMLFDYIDGGAFSEVSLQRNIDGWNRVEIDPRVLVDVSRISTDVRIFNSHLSAPLILAPVGIAGMFARRGEVQAAQAADLLGVPFCLSTLSVCSLMEVTSATQHPPWFQLYVLKDRGVTAGLMEVAKQQGCKVLVLTVDLPVAAPRYRDFRSGFYSLGSPQNRLRRIVDVAKCPGWISDVLINGAPHHLGNFQPTTVGKGAIQDLLAWVANNFDPGLTWDDIRWIRDRWSGPIVVKGIMRRSDAAMAMHIGLDGIVVSNHGGRQMDGTRSTAQILPEIVSVVGSSIPVIVDGGIRTGLDILRALSLGARACMIGRPWAFALAAEGRDGVKNLIEMFKRELRIAMALVGCSDLENLQRDLREEESRV